MIGRGQMGKQIATARSSRNGGEGSAKDMAEDKKMAKARGMSMAQWERSGADKKHDAPKKMAKGGSVTRGDGACMKGHTKGTMR